MKQIDTSKIFVYDDVFPDYLVQSFLKNYMIVRGGSMVFKEEKEVVKTEGSLLYGYIDHTNKQKIHLI